MQQIMDSGSPELDRRVPTASDHRRLLMWMPQTADRHLIMALELAIQLLSLPIPEEEPTFSVA